MSCRRGDGASGSLRHVREAGARDTHPGRRAGRRRPLGPASRWPVHRLLHGRACGGVRTRPRIHDLRRAPHAVRRPSHRNDAFRLLRALSDHGADGFLQGYRVGAQFSAGGRAVHDRKQRRREHVRGERRGPVRDHVRRGCAVHPDDRDLFHADRMVSARRPVPLPALPPGGRVPRGARLGPVGRRRLDRVRDHVDSGTRFPGFSTPRWS